MSEAQQEQQDDVHFSPAIELREKFWSYKRDHIKILPAAQNTRASSIGHECMRFLVYERHEKFASLRVPPTPSLQCLFDLGRELEAFTFSELRGMGVEIVQTGRDYLERRYELSGHVDAKIRLSGWKRAIPAEVKGLNPFLAGKLSTIDDVRHHPDGFVRRYYAQLQTYLYLDGSDFGVFVLLNKSSGQIEFIDCPLDYGFAESLLQKAERVRDYLAADELPPRTLCAECERCAFRAPCAPDMEYGPGVAVLQDEELARLIDRRAELAKSKSEYDAIDRALKKKLPEHGQVVVGDWVVAGKQVHNNGYRVEPFDYWRRDYRRVEKTMQETPTDELIDASSLGKEK